MTQGDELMEEEAESSEEDTQEDTNLEYQEEDSDSNWKLVILPPGAVVHRDFRTVCILSQESLWSFSFCTKNYDMIYMHVDALFMCFL